MLHGSTIHIDVKAIRFIYNGKICGLVTIRDITAQKRVEEKKELEQQAENL